MRGLMGRLAEVIGGMTRRVGIERALSLYGGCRKLRLCVLLCSTKRHPILIDCWYDC